MSAERTLGGLDIGTTGCKLTVLSEDGTLLARAYRDYPVQRGSTHEVDAAAILTAVTEVLKEIGAKHPDISGIGVTSFGETFVMTDAAGTPLYPAMLYTDPRGKEECAALTEALGREKIISLTGLNPHEMYSLPKLMWLKKHRPDLYRQAAHVLLMEDFIVYSLTGTAQIDYSLATRTMGFDLRKLCWSDEIFAAAGIDKALFSHPVPTGTAAGTLLPAIAAETGLSASVQIVNVSHDQIAAAVGAGVFDAATAVDGAGTVECLTPMFDRLPDLQTMSRGNYAVVPYVLPDTYVCYAFSYTGGELLRWCVDTLAKQEKADAKAQGQSVNALLEGTEDAPTGLLVLPHFAGAATPYMDTGSRGAILGLTTATSVSTLYRACMEGVAYELRLNYDRLASQCRIARVLATGGGARSQVWMQMKADLLNLPMVAMETEDAGTVGCAMLTGVAIGVYADIPQAAAVMVKPLRVYTPRPEMHLAYEKHYARYCKLYDAVRPLMEEVL